MKKTYLKFDKSGDEYRRLMDGFPIESSIKSYVKNVDPGNTQQ